MKINYSSNNSGGSWWLSDEDWLALEKAGWDVDWYKDRGDDPRDYKDGRFMGALATEASKDFPTMDKAIAEFEAITREDAYAEGCSCCGRPHDFYEYND